MSNQYRKEGHRNFPKAAKKFVPKGESTATKTLSSSLLQSLSQQSQGGSSTSSSCGSAEPSSRVRPGEHGDWVSSKLHSGKFVNYLPQDEAVAAGLGADEGALDPEESQRVADLLNQELSRLLKLNARDFWREVASDASLHAFLESFLKFRSRWYDFPYRGPKGIVAGVIVGEFELCRRVLMVLYRISSNRDPGAKVADSLSPKDHAALLQEKKLLDLPKLLDVCAIYGHENEDLTRMLVCNAMKAQPWLHDDFTALVSHFLSIVQTMHQRCSSSLEALFSSEGRTVQGSNRLHADYLEVIDFINDAVVSMDAFVSAYKHAAIFFSCPIETSHGNDELLTAIARLHDSLLPSLQKGFRTIFEARQDAPGGISSDMLSNVSISLKMLSMRITQLGWKLLYFCYLSNEAFDENRPQASAMKMFPATVEDPTIRADVLLQSLRDVSGISQASERHSWGTFLQNIEQTHHMMSRIELLRNAGWISMDDEQFQFVSNILMHHPVQRNVKVMQHITTQETDEDTAITESKISQIKDLFPDYGKGFLAACLEVYNQDPEEVIQRILEGTLHEDLQSLDRSLDEMKPPMPVAKVSTSDKGKGKLSEPAMEPSISTVHREERYQGQSSSGSAVGRYTRKATSDAPEYETLNARNDKDLAKTAALALQLEYEDEYDDSFDDLGLSVGDSGLEESEMLEDKLNLRKEASSNDNSGNSKQTNSKWGSRQKPQFYVKDGKNYSYKVAGSVAAANYNEATLVNQTQRGMIHGLGRGGNVALGAVRKLSDSNEEENEGVGTVEAGGRGGVNFRGGGRRGGGRNQYRKETSNDKEDEEADTGEVGGRGAGNFRGRGRRGGGRSSFRKDMAMKKHFSGLSGY